MIRVLSRSVGVVVVLLALGAGLAPLGCKPATKDNPAVCVSDTDEHDHCASNETCINHICTQIGGRSGGIGTGGAVGSGGAGGRATVGSGGAGGTAGQAGAGAIGGAGAADGGVMDGAVDQTHPMDAPVDKPMCTPTETTACPTTMSSCSSEGKCVECTPSDNKCAATLPVCKDNACGKCSLESDCSARPMTPHCDTAGGACVECTKNEECTPNAAKPVCDTANHVCVKCVESKNCPASTPICNTAMHTCGACTQDEQCKARGDSNRLNCDIAAKICVECASNAHCAADPRKPICVNNACAPCTSDQHCKGIGPGVCMFHQDGHCATDAETLYVQKITGCAMAAGAAGAGSITTPFCLPQTAVELAQASTAKQLVVLRGGAPLANFSAAPAMTELSVIGQNEAQISPGAFIGIHLTVGALYVRGVTVLNGTDIGIKADELSTLRLDRVYSYSNALGGLVLAKASFDVVNSIFANNGPGVVGAVGFGGVYIGAPPAGGKLARFAFNTIVNNADKGVACESMQGLSALLLYNNTTGDAINCGVNSSKTGDPIFQSGTNNYHLSATSPCRNFVTGTAPIDDYEGNPRPSGAAADCGAYEFIETP